MPSTVVSKTSISALRCFRLHKFSGNPQTHFNAELDCAVPCPPDLRGLLSQAIETAGNDGVMTLPSGATHDASAMADLCDIAMLFVRCRDGVSHRPEEYASAADMAVAIEVLTNTLMALNEEP